MNWLMKLLGLNTESSSPKIEAVAPDFEELKNVKPSDIANFPEIIERNENVVEFLLQRIQSEEDFTTGVLYKLDPELPKVARDFMCFTLEDEHRDVKVAGETRIPAGRYEIKFYKYGKKFHEPYKAKYGDWHQGMLHLQDVPGFTYILIHCGNTDKDTDGCILVGDTANSNMGTIASSRQAYNRIYPVFRDALLEDKQVFLTVEDFA